MRSFAATLAFAAAVLGDVSKDLSLDTVTGLTKGLPAVKGLPIVSRRSSPLDVVKDLPVGTVTGLTKDLPLVKGLPIVGRSSPLDITKDLPLDTVTGLTKDLPVVARSSPLDTVSGLEKDLPLNTVTGAEDLALNEVSGLTKGLPVVGRRSLDINKYLPVALAKGEITKDLPVVARSAPLDTVSGLEKDLPLNTVTGVEDLALNEVSSVTKGLPVVGRRSDLLNVAEDLPVNLDLKKDVSLALRSPLSLTVDLDLCLSIQAKLAALGLNINAQISALFAKLNLNVDTTKVEDLLQILVDGQVDLEAKVGVQLNKVQAQLDLAFDLKVATVAYFNEKVGLKVDVDTIELLLIKLGIDVQAKLDVGLDLSI
jgi:hypothetical protein